MQDKTSLKVQVQVDKILLDTYPINWICFGS